MRILITNDDGIHAEGLTALEEIARALTDDVWVVAPEYEQSGASRALTLAEPVRVRLVDTQVYAVSGTPTDCVMLALTELMGDAKPDLVLSGVNRGQNLGEDISMSGTVAGAIQGMVCGVRSIALSQALERFHDEIYAHYETAEAFAPGVIARLLEIGWPAEAVININFPALAPEKVTTVEVTAQGQWDVNRMHAERRTDLRGRDYFWMGFKGRAASAEEGTDLAAIAAGRISVTPLHIDMTHREACFSLKGVLGGAPPRLRPAAAREA